MVKVNGQPVVEESDADSGIDSNKENAETTARGLIFPVATNEDGDDILFGSDTPEGFDYSVHVPIRRKYFAHDKYYFEHRALFHDFMAQISRDKSHDAAKFGTKAEQKIAKRVVSLNGKMKALKAELEAAGVDIKDVLDV